MQSHRPGEPSRDLRRAGSCAAFRGALRSEIPAGGWRDRAGSSAGHYWETACTSICRKGAEREPCDEERPPRMRRRKDDKNVLELLSPESNSARIEFSCR